MLGLEDNIQKIKGIGAKKAELFAKLDVDTVRSLVYMLPMRYEIYQFCNSLADIKAEGCVAFYMQYNGGIFNIYIENRLALSALFGSISLIY